MAHTHTEITRNDEANRYEAHVDGALAGFAEYALTSEVITFTHTEVDDAYEGQGVGSALARGALDDAIRRGDRRIKVVCPFIRAWIERHPDYQHLLEGSPAT
jgi:predicted GNAT family acetyltransferase